MRYLPAQNEVIRLEYHFKSTLKHSEKGDIQLVSDDSGRLFVRRYRELTAELFGRIKSVSCPYIERLIEQSADENGGYIISEYIEGMPASERTFTESEAILALSELCEAVQALHQAGILHRDIKPSNIICQNDGHIRLIDFDSARLGKAYRSRDTKLLGTAGFAPPEQFGFAQTDPRSDIYSFGVTMREILGNSAEKPKFKRIIDRCMQFVPEKRYSDIGAVKRAVLRASRPNILPFAAAGVLLAAGGVFLLFCSKPAPTPPTADTSTGSTFTIGEPTVKAVSEPTETLDIPTKETNPTEESEPTIEPIPTDEPEIIPTKQAESESALAETEPSEIPETVIETTMESETTPEIQETTPAEEQESSPEPPETEPTEEPEQPREPNILSDSINPNKIDFDTIINDDGLYTDEFEYEFYDDPAVHGEWELYAVLDANTDFEWIATDYLAKSNNLGNYLWQHFTVYPDGSCEMRNKRGGLIEKTLWTNGYYIEHDNGCQFVRRMFAFTVDGADYLVYEQKPTGNYKTELPHRVLLFGRIL
ncbi:MAG: serine/threonine protein kinase [Oscillospiraceae bacterium]